MTAAIATHGLTKRYGNRTALAGLDLEVPPGRVFGMIGPNGAGKTTTMRLLLDLIRPTSGSVRVLGEDPRTAGPELRRRIGFLPGELRLGTRTDGRRFLSDLAAVSGPVAAGRVDALAARLGVDLSRPIRKLSKGNKQKIGILQAFQHDPDLLLLDEPTSGLDPLVQREFLTLVREASERGATVFLSSHVLSEIEQVADTVGILRAGNLAAVAPVEELRRSALRRSRVAVPPGDELALGAALRALAGVSEVAESREAGRGVVTTAISTGVGAFVHALAAFEVLDLVVEEADLEDVVLRYYGDDGSARP